MKKITDKQMRLIHALVRKLGWSKEEYREFVLMFNKSGSLKDLSITQGSTIIRELTDLTSDTPQMATPGQVKYIVEHWECVDDSLMEHGDTHLHSFLRHKFGVTTVYALTKKQASGAIAAIRNMEKRSMELARQRAIEYEIEQAAEPISQAYVTLDGRIGLMIATGGTKVIDIPLKLDGNGRPN